MPVEFVQVRLSVKPKIRGEAELVPPKVLEGLNYQFVIVKDGGEEAIVKLEAPKEVLKKLEKDKDCKKLATDQAKKLQRTYPPPKLTRKYRRTPHVQAASEPGTISGPFAADAAGNRIIDTYQIVRVGFYLIDVPVST